MKTKQFWTNLLFAYGLCAQSNSIFVNGTPLRIGMGKANVLSSVADGNELSSVKGLDDAWCVRAKGHDPKSGCEALIQFKQDTLVVVSKTLGTAAGEDAAAMIATFFSTLDQLAKAGKTDLAFSTQEIETDDHLRLRILSFMAGDRKFTLTAQQPVGSQTAKSSSVDLTESFVLASDRAK
jgi:hypothetical protein